MSDAIFCFGNEILAFLVELNSKHVFYCLSVCREWGVGGVGVGGVPYPWRGCVLVKTHLSSCQPP